ncbi:proline--tRNA ligase [candidate division TA06 bacterium]|nr:proline--tRNA ligase [candidate division TA06 bacterium]
MRWSKLFIPTLKETPAEAEVKSHQLALKAGLIRPLASGVYSILPLGWKVLKRIEGIIREEMERIGAQEFFLPALSTRELWTETGRWKDYGEDMFRLKDRKDRDLCLAPTHEEVITDLARKEIRSYRNLPQIWYQIQMKFRDEPRPRSALLRAREFIMKDSYSLDRDEEGLDRSYTLHVEAYKRIFTRCGLEFFTVGAFSGLMGGSASEEFMVLSPAGEDEVVLCDKCSYRANLDVAVGVPSPIGFEDQPLQEVHTPEMKRVEEVAGFLKVEPKQLMKSLLYIQDKTPIFILLRGDHELKEAKLTAHIGGNLRPATPEEVLKRIGAEIGFIGPVGVEGIHIVADLALKGEKGLITGANRKDYHVRGVNLERDLYVDEFQDLRQVVEGDTCLECEGRIKIEKAIEVGHTFKLGKKFSKVMKATYADEKGKERLIVMGSYGIGLERIMFATIEQKADGDGIVWPLSIAPYDLLILPLNVNHSETVEIGENLYQELSSHYKILYDDRDVRAGEKFKDGDLIGIPLRITIGERNLKDGNVEIRVRSTKEVFTVKPEEVREKLKRIVNSE